MGGFSTFAASLLTGACSALAPLALAQHSMRPRVNPANRCNSPSNLRISIVGSTMVRKFAAILLLCLALAGSGENCVGGEPFPRLHLPLVHQKPRSAAPIGGACGGAACSVVRLFAGTPPHTHTGRPTPPSHAAAQAGGWHKPKPKPKVPHTVAELREWGSAWEVSATRQAAHAVRGFRTYCKTLCPVHLGGSHPTLSAPLPTPNTPVSSLPCCSRDCEGAGL